MALVRLVIVFLACAGVNIVLAEHNLTIMLITSFGEFGFDSSGAIPAADVALDDINGNNSMLPGYRLVYDKPRNSQVPQMIKIFYSSVQGCKHATVNNYYASLVALV